MSQKVQWHQRKGFIWGVKYTQNEEKGGVEWGNRKMERKFGCKMSQTSVPPWCNCNMLAAQSSRSVMVLISGPNPSPWGCARRSSVDLQTWIRTQSIQRHTPFFTPFPVNNGIYTYKTSATRSSCGVMPGNSRFPLLLWCQKEDTPRLDLIWVSKERMVPCRFSPCLCERGRADMEGRLETKLNTQEMQEASYGLGNFNDIVCDRV